MTDSIICTRMHIHIWMIFGSVLHFSDRFFIVVMIGGVGIIFLGFSLIEPKALIDDGIFTQKDKLLGIGVIFSFVHVVLTNIARISFKKIKHANLLIDKKLQDLRAIDTAKTEFMAMISHELKTPLVPILAYTRMLRDERFGKVPESQKEKLHLILEATESLAILVQDILDLQKAELGKLKLKCDFADLREIVDEAIKRVTPLANKYGIRIEDHIETNTKLWVDRNRMIQVFSNLLKNSVDFVPPGEGIIQVLLEYSNEHVIVIVKDNGCGIPKENLGSLFKKFYQVDTSSTRERGGTGLGLAICKTIVENHGGKIWVESEIGHGTIMKIQIPTIKQLARNKVENLVQQ